MAGPPPDERRAMRSAAEFRFYEELNDFLPAHRRKRSFQYEFDGAPAIKDALEAIGVPHTEVDLILIDGRPVDFAAPLHDGARVAVYPQFERFDISGLTRLRPAPLREPRFVLDVHLGALARRLRLLGFDAVYRNDYSDEAIVDTAEAEQRIVLTRDIGLLKRSRVTRGHWLRATAPDRQAVEVVTAFDLAGVARPLSRCIRCNGPLEAASRAAVAGAVPSDVLARHACFSRCRDCGRIYWPGSHHRRLTQRAQALLGQGKENGARSR